MASRRELGLHGRDAETQAIDDALDRLASGTRAVVLVEGEAGIGKTRLLTEALYRARQRGFDVARGQGEDLERNRPFGVVADAFGCTVSSPDPRRAAIAELLFRSSHDPGGAGPITVTSDPGLQYRAVDAFVDLAEDLALRGPLLIGVDNLQWADPSSVLTLSALSRRLADLPVGLIGCFRPLPYVSPAQRLAAVLDAAGACHLRLEPLPDAVVSALVAEAVAAEPGPRLVAAMARAGGNPLFVIELCAAITRSGALTITDGRAEVDQPALPRTLRLTILHRLGLLSEESLHTLQVASLLGTSFTLIDLSIVLNRPAVDVLHVLSEAIVAGVLSDDGARLRFRHDLIRDAIYEETPGGVRLALHREAGQRLAAAGAAAVQVAEQLARGAMPADAVEWLVRAARDASATSPAGSVGLLERAIELMPTDDPARDRLLAERAGSLLWAGRVADSEAACRAILDRPHDPAADAPARICLGHAMLAAGLPRKALRELEAAAEAVPASASQRARALGYVSLTRLWLGDLDSAVAVSEQAASAARAAGDPLAASMAAGSLCGVAQVQARLRDAMQIIDDAVHDADRSPGRQGHRNPLHADRGFVLIDLDRFDEAFVSLDAGRRVSEELGVAWHLPSFQIVGAVARYLAGQWDDALTDIEASIEAADELDVTRTPHSRVRASSVLSLIRLHRNDIAGAAQAAEAAMGDLASAGPRYRTQWAPWAYALTLEADGKIADAFAALTPVWDECIEAGLLLECRMFGADLIRLALAVGDQRLAADVASTVDRVAAQNDVSSLTGAAFLCRGLAGDDPEALAAAVDAYACAPRPLELAQACEVAGVAFARNAARDKATTLLEQAMSIYERLDAIRDMLRTEAVLRELGVRRGRRGARGRPRTGWPSLTPTERTVAQLVADGLSNPQVGDRLYVSRRTVQTHLGHIFAKLDISSRAQLAAEVVRHQ